MKRTVSATVLVIGCSGLLVGALARWGDLPSPTSVALALPTCDCPEKQCANGTVAGCTVTCPGGQEAVCVCDGFCDSNGNAGGLNRCACQ